MERVFLLPDPGEGLEEAEIVEWLVKEGDSVELNQPFVEVETAKAAVEIPSPYEGQIMRLHAAAGDSVRVGAPLVTFEVEGVAAMAEAADPAGPPEVADRASLVPQASLAPQGPLPSGDPADKAQSAPTAATPAVRKLAKQLAIDLSSVEPTGPEGRVTTEDVARAAGAGSSPESATRRTIARNLERAAAIPQVTTFRTVECSELERLRRELGVSPLPIFVVALARTCANHPLLNATSSDDRDAMNDGVNVGIAVDTDRGLVVPVLRSAQTRGIADVDGEITRLAHAAREGSLTPSDMTGATITVSNTGSYGSEAGTPLLNPPCAVTVALGVIAPRALVVEGEVRARPAATISLTFDHRILDGAAAGRALTDLVDLLQTRIGELPR